MLIVHLLPLSAAGISCMFSGCIWRLMQVSRREFVQLRKSKQYPETSGGDLAWWHCCQNSTEFSSVANYHWLKRTFLHTPRVCSVGKGKHQAFETQSRRTRRSMASSPGGLGETRQSAILPIQTFTRHNGREQVRSSRNIVANNDGHPQLGPKIAVEDAVMRRANLDLTLYMRLQMLDG